MFIYPLLNIHILIMMKTEIILPVLLAVGIVVLAVMVGLKPNNITVKASSELPKDTIDVTGTYTSTVDPDKAEIFLGVETQEQTAIESQQKNAEIMDKVKSALRVAGVSDKDMETEQFSVDIMRDYSEFGRQKVIGYKTTHILKISTTKLNTAGSLVDAAIDAGANNVGGVQFTLSKSKEAEVRKEAVMKASLNAKERAQAIADGLGIKLTKVSKASEGYVNVVPYYKGFGGAMAAESMRDATTSISPGKIEISSSINVGYEFS